MIGAKKLCHFLLLLLILAKSKVLTCQEYEANLVEYDQQQQTSRKHSKHNHHTNNHHNHHNHHRHRPKAYFHFDDDETLRHFNIDVDVPPQYDNAVEDYQSDDYKTREYLQMDTEERWPKFEEIERMAGISEWKRERWKHLLNSEETRSTQKPPSSRVQKFTYRRVQGSVNGSKRNAIIAVSAIAPRVRSKE